MKFRIIDTDSTIELHEWDGNAWKLIQTRWYGKQCTFGDKYVDIPKQKAIDELKEYAKNYVIEEFEV